VAPRHPRRAGPQGGHLSLRAGPRRAWVAALAFGLLVAACAADDTTTTGGPPSEDGTARPDGSTASSTGASSTAATEPTASATSTTPPPAVETLALDLVDASRATPAGAATPARADRPLPTTVWFPDDDTAHPLIVFAHGLSGHPEKFRALLAAWASAGYVVAAPAFPLTNSEVESSWDNFVDAGNQPADLTFVTDQVLAANDDPTSPLAGRIDPERIGFGGLSLGGATTYLAGMNEVTRDPRVDAAMALDAVAFTDEATGTFLEPSGVPALVAHCRDDPLAPLGIAEQAYGLLGPPKYLVVLEGACHAEAFEDTPHDLDEAATALTIAFWDAWLGGAGGDAEQAALETVLDDLGDHLTWDAEAG
jgi:predicted dienelactone hydrolase